MFHACPMTEPTASSLRRELAVLRRRIAVARDRGLPTTELEIQFADLEVQLDVVLTNIEIAKRVALQAAAGYRPVAA